MIYVIQFGSEIYVMEGFGIGICTYAYCREEPTNQN